MKRTCAALAVAVGVGATAWSGVARADEDWQAAGRRAVAEARALAPSARDAKNAVLFVGDGMGIATVTAARILDGQQHGQSGEENLLAFERLPYVALSKTYNTNQQVPESSGTMTAMVTGSKTTAGVLSIDSSVPVGDHRAVKGHELETLFERAEARGYATGIVTTTTITHATPGACYAHVPDRDWESDARLSDAARADGFPDIARQLVEFRAGDGLEVAFGGGRAFFLPAAAQDPEYAEQRGERRDDRDLTAEWVAKGPQRRFVWNRAGFTDLDAKMSPQVLGLFEPSHLKFEVLRASDPGGEPSLAEMTAKAIELLRGRGRGFVLMVEGGRIDHGHHAGSAYLALNEAVSFSRAVEAGLARVDLAGRPYTTLGYANGPGHPGETDQQPAGPKRFPHRPKKASGAATTRPDLREVDTQAPTYLQESAVPLESETHGGEDVAIYAGGPGAQLFHGVQEQSYVYHAIAAALGWDPPRNAPAAGD